MARKLLPAAAVVALAALLSACGVKGPPELASDRADMYPRVYPQGAVPPDAAPTSIYIERYPDRAH
jgi:hypothetical protein